MAGIEKAYRACDFGSGVTYCVSKGQEIERLRTALAEAQQENAELRADVAWVAHVYKSGDMWLLYPPSHNGSVRAFDGTDADLCRAIREARRGE